MELNEKFNIIFYNRGVGGFITDELGINDLSYPDIPIAQMIDHYDQILCQVKAALPSCAHQPKDRLSKRGCQKTGRKISRKIHGYQ